MTTLDFIVLTLAASAVVDVWFNGSLFASWRSYFQSVADDSDDDYQEEIEEAEGHTNVEAEEEKLPLAMRVADKVIPRPVAELMTCSFCLSHHTPWLVGLLFLMAKAVECYLVEPVAPNLTGGYWPGLHEWSLRSTEPQHPYKDLIVFVLKLPAYSLAATRIGNIINACVPKEAKYQNV